MIQSLRKRHRYIWIVWGVVLPFGFVLVLLNLNGPRIPSGAPQLEAEPDAWMLLDESENLSVWRSQSENGEELKIGVFEPLKSPFVTVYQDDISGGSLGRIAETGDYYFRTEGHPHQLVFYDEIKKIILLKVDLK